MRSGLTVTTPSGPASPTTTDQKYAGRSRDAQCMYRSGVLQKSGAAPAILDWLGLWGGGRRRKEEGEGDAWSLVG